MGIGEMAFLHKNKESMHPPLLLQLSPRSSKYNDHDVVYIGKPTFWSNPFFFEQEGKKMDYELNIITTKMLKYEDTHKFAQWLAGEYVDQNPRIQSRREQILKHIDFLKGKFISCNCGQDSYKCHGNVLLILANEGSLLTYFRDWMPKPKPTQNSIGKAQLPYKIVSSSVDATKYETLRTSTEVIGKQTSFPDLSGKAKSKNEHYAEISKAADAVKRMTESVSNTGSPDQTVFKNSEIQPTFPDEGKMKAAAATYHQTSEFRPWEYCDEWLENNSQKLPAVSEHDHTQKEFFQMKKIAKEALYKKTRPVTVKVRPPEISSNTSKKKPPTNR